MVICPPARRIAPDCVDGGRVGRNDGVVVAERRRHRENNGTADLWPPNGIRVAAVGLDVVNENNMLSGILPVRRAGSQTALDVSLLLLFVNLLKYISDH